MCFSFFCSLEGLEDPPSLFGGYRRYRHTFKENAIIWYSYVYVMFRHIKKWVKPERLNTFSKMWIEVIPSALAPSPAAGDHFPAWCVGDG